MPLIPVLSRYSTRKKAMYLLAVEPQLLGTTIRERMNRERERERETQTDRQRHTERE